MKILMDLLKVAKGVTCHSGEVSHGYVFVAIYGRKTDGNCYAAQAAARGAISIVTDRPEHLPPLSIPVHVVANARQALSFLAAYFYGHPSQRLSLTGVTGSNGKTTITFMLEHIFRHIGLLPGLIGTVRVNTGSTTFASKLTTPDAVNIHHYLAQMCQNGVTHAAMEVSAQGVEMHRVDHVNFTCGILTNICEDHLDFHQDFESYLAAKEQFLALLGQRTPLVVNIDDAYCRDIQARYHGPVITTSVTGNADVTAKIIHTTAYGSKASITISRPLTSMSGHKLPVAKFDLELPIPGRHNVENAILTIAAALLQDIPPEAAIAALADFQGVERRMEIYRMDGMTVVDDTALNPGSIDAIFTTIQSFRYLRLIVVNAIRGQRGAAINRLNATALARWQQEVPFNLIATAADDAVGAADKVTTEEQQAFLQELELAGADYTYSTNLRPAILQAIFLASPGDIILLLGAQGMDAGHRVLSQELATLPAQPSITAAAVVSV